MLGLALSLSVVVFGDRAAAALRGGAIVSRHALAQHTRNLRASREEHASSEPGWEVQALATSLNESVFRVKKQSNYSEPLSDSELLLRRQLRWASRPILGKGDGERVVAVLHLTEEGRSRDGAGVGGGGKTERNGRG